jgi:hypothetical protein
MRVRARPGCHEGQPIRPVQRFTPGGGCEAAGRGVGCGGSRAWGGRHQACEAGGGEGAGGEAAPGLLEVLVGVERVPEAELEALRVAPAPPMRAVTVCALLWRPGMPPAAWRYRVPSAAEPHTLLWGRACTAQAPARTYARRCTSTCAQRPRTSRRVPAPAHVRMACQSDGESILLLSRVRASARARACLRA